MKHRVAAFAAAFLALAAQGAAAAQEDPRPREIFHQVEGPYEVGLALQPYIPAVGQVHFILRLTDPANGEPIDDAIVSMRADHEQEAAEPLASPILHYPEDPGSYRANMTFLESGNWVFAITIEKGDAEPVDVELTLPVAEPPLPAGQAGTFVWIIVFLALIGGILFLWNRSRRISDTDSIVRRW